MSSPSQIIAICLALLILFSVVCGCVSSSIGDVSYTNGGLAATISNPDQPTNAFVQVTIYQVMGLSQQEQSYVMTSVKLKSGDNNVFIPFMLKPGNYKLNIYLIQDGERKTAVIRDIVV
jgi:major membrane immunogen (membrane-anchored lipoprotein)